MFHGFLLWIEKPDWKDERPTLNIQLSTFNENRNGTPEFSLAI